MNTKSFVPAAALSLLIFAAAVPQAQEDCSGEITARVLQLLQSNTDGVVGLYLKEVGGPVLAACNEQRIFEPASTIKVVHHLHAMLQVQNGSVVQGKVVTLDTEIEWFADYNTAISYSCPGDSGRRISPLRDVLAGMMKDSDNRHTQALRVFFGEENINATAKAIGMNDTALRHRIGCGGGRDGAVAKPNRLTLYDAGLLYEKVADGSLLTPDHRKDFYALMPGKEYDSSGVWRNIQRIIDEEAPTTMTTARKNSFAQQTETRYKGGSYDLCSPGCLQYRTMAGWAQIPFCEGERIVLRQYVFGVFAVEAVSAQPAFLAVRSGAELLREQLRVALQSCA